MRHLNHIATIKYRQIANYSDQIEDLFKNAGKLVTWLVFPRESRFQNTNRKIFSLKCKMLQSD